MKFNSLAIAFGAIAVVFLAVFLIGIVNAGNPEIRVVPPAYDFGKIPQKKVEHEFRVMNEGQETLEIEQITTSCGCTTAEIDSGKIEPGKTARLIVRFDPNAMEETVQGSVQRIVYIKSNDPERPEIEIEISAEVEGGE